MARGFFGALTPEQQEAALAYRGDDTIGYRDSMMTDTKLTAATCPLVGYPAPVVTEDMIDAGMEAFINHASEDIETVMQQVYIAMRQHRPLSEGPQ